MFGKLLKNELLSNIKLIGIVCAIILGIGILCKILFAIELNGDLAIVILIALGLAIIAAYVLTIIHIFNTFSRNTFGDRGYVTFQIPVSSHELIWSKVLGALIFLALCGVCTFIAVILVAEGLAAYIDPSLIEGVVGNLLSAQFSLSGIIETFIQYFYNLQTLMSVAVIFTILNIGKFKGNKTVLAIALYLGLAFVNSTIVSIFDPINLGLALTVDSILIEPMETLYQLGLSYYSIFDMILAAVEIVGFYFLSVYLLDTQLELE